MKVWWTCGSGFIELELAAEDAHCGSHQGKCDDDIAALRVVPYIQKQLDALDRNNVARTLKEYGAWDETELSDHDANLSRLLWIACCDIREQHGVS